MIKYTFPCSISGTTTITSSIVADPSTGTFPSWVSVNPDYLHLNVNSPSYGTTNDYTFNIRSEILGVNVDILTTITVYKCQVDHWDSWEYNTQNIWASWSSSYILSSDCSTWSLPEMIISQPLVEMILIIVISGGVGSSIVNSLIFGSSTNAIWAFINQFQLYLVIPFFKSYLTIVFVGMLSNLAFGFCSFEFLNGIKLVYIDSSSNDLDYPQEDKRFNDSGMISGSFVVNEHNYIKSLLNIFILNIIFIIFRLILGWFLKRRWEKVMKGLSEFFHFRAYIRIILSGYIFWLLWSLSENYTIYNIRDNTVSYLISIAASLIALSFIPFIYICSVYWKESKYFLELFGATKPSKIKKLYYMFFILRRTLMLFVIIFLKELPAQPKLIINVVIQLLSLGYSCIARPLKKNNEWLVDIVNDVFYLASWVIVCFIEEESTRGEFLNTALIIILLVNQSTIWIISFVYLSILLIKKLARYWKDCHAKRMNKVHAIHTESSDGNILVLKVSSIKGNERSRELGIILI